MQYIEELMAGEELEPSPANLGFVKDYLRLKHVQALFSYYRDEEKVSKNYRGPSLSSYIEALQRMFSAFRGAS